MGEVLLLLLLTGIRRAGATIDPKRDDGKTGD
jgi:hypothetical protein